MSKLALLLLVAAKTVYPGFSAPVVDQANVVPAVVEQRLDDSLNAYQQASGNQIGVAVVKDTGDQSVEDYANDLFNDHWKLGDEEKDNGVLLLVVMGDRKLKIEVGFGLEDQLTDVESGRIIRDEIAPRMRAGDVGGAVEVGTNAIRRALGDKTVGAAPAPPTTQAPSNDGGGSFAWLGILFVLFVLSSITGGFGRRRRRRWGLGTPIIWGGGFGGGGFGGFGGGGGGGFGGGFGGGGGGGSGGGGASGGW
jgi:uncharacterized protein